MIKIGVYAPANVVHSVRSYLNNLEPYLEQHNIKLFRFDRSHSLSETVDLYWDPRAGRTGPHASVQGTRQPYVVTYHGAGHLGYPLTSMWQPAYKAYLLGTFRRIQTRYQWGRSMIKRPAQIITVSKYAKDELKQHLGWDSVVIYHGLAHDLFKPLPNPRNDSLLHVSSLAPIKNIRRMLDAYHSIDLENKPRFVVISGGKRFYRRNLQLEGIELLDHYIPHERLAAYYQHALAFVFPSLHETFGMPISEAMAAGCPVITSHDTACAEIAGDAALLVNPYDTDSIAAAIHQMITGQALRDKLRQRGLKRAADFTWQKSAQEHVAVFEQVLGHHS